MSSSQRARWTQLLTLAAGDLHPDLAVSGESLRPWVLTEEEESLRVRYYPSGRPRWLLSSESTAG